MGTVQNTVSNIKEMAVCVLVLVVLLGVVLGPVQARPEEGEAAVLERVKRGCCLCVCGSGKRKRAAEGQVIDQGMTKRFAPELELLSHYRSKRSARMQALQEAGGWCCCICVGK